MCVCVRLQGVDRRLIKLLNAVRFRRLTLILLVKIYEGTHDDVGQLGEVIPVSAGMYRQCYRFPNFSNENRAKRIPKRHKM